jgi:hypothetical protein
LLARISRYVKIARIGFDAPAVVVLGAGATRGASFVQKLHGALPPLDGDFFTQLQRMSTAKPTQLVTNVIENTVGLFGKNFGLTMEQCFTHIEQLINVFDDYRRVGRPPRNPYRRMRDDLIQALAALLDESIGRNPECDYHRKLVKALSVRDVLLSFNYDWVIDHTLKCHGHDKWNPGSSYGVRTYSDSGQFFWAEHIEDGSAYYPAPAILLLKMHGSMNWFPLPSKQESRQKKARVRLRQRWWHQRGTLRFEIAPPEWNKPIRSGVYRQIWTHARQALRKSSAMVFIGYSLPETDLPARALFMVDTLGSRLNSVPALDLLVIANPDPLARRRIRQTISARIAPGTRMLTFDTLREFAEFLRSED